MELHWQEIVAIAIGFALLWELAHTLNKLHETNLESKRCLIEIQRHLEAAVGELRALRSDQNSHASELDALKRRQDRQNTTIDAIAGANGEFRS